MYICNDTEATFLRWRIEPGIIISTQFRFFDDTPPQDETIGNVVAILVSNNPLISRLRIPNNAGFSTGTVVCVTDSGNKSADYNVDNYGMLTT